MDLQALGEPLPPAVPFEVNPAEGTASNGTAVLAVHGGKVWARRGIKRALSPQAQTVEWAVAELEGVRVYFDGTTVIVTKQDLWP